MNNSQNLYLDLEKLIKPRLLDDFCGYDEENQSFNIVLAVKQIIEAKEQECEKLKAIVTEAEEAPICFHCSEEPCIRQERDKYKKLSVDFKNVNKYLGHKYITLKKALNEIERVWETDQDGDYDFMKFKILNIINKIKEQ